MKNVLLLLTGHPSHGTVRDYFDSVHAPLTDLDPAASPEELRKREPGLCVIAAEHAAPGLLYFLREHATIVITDEGTPGEVQASPGKSKLAKATWPVERDEFLRLAAQMARLSERRLFRAIVRVSSSERSAVHLGQSIDFSGLGMAFQSKESFRIGEKLDVSLSLPSRNERLRLPVEVTRIVDRGREGQNIYGARFTEIDEPTRTLLERFISEA